MEKKRSKGITIIGILFIIYGVFSISSPFYLNLLHQERMSYIVRGTMTRLNDIRGMLQKLEIEDKDYRLEIENEIDSIKRDLFDHKKNYPFSFKLALVLLIIRCTLFLYSGILILRLKRTGRVVAFWAIFVSFISSLLILVDAYYSTNDFFGLVRRLHLLASKISPNVKPFTMQAIELFTNSQSASIIIGSFIYYAVILLFVVFFFTRPKVKEQFQ